MTTASRLARWLVPRPAAGPVYEQLADGLRTLVLDGRIAVGCRVPAERELAATLGVARATVTVAYDKLRGEGYLVSRHGGGTVVCLPGKRAARPDCSAADDVRFDLTVAALPASALIADAATTGARLLSSELARSGLHPLGLPILREAIAAKYSDAGIATDADQILVTNGALQAWNLLLRALTRPGDSVITEQPTYPGVLDAAAAHHLQIQALPVDADGWDVAQLPRFRRPPVVAHLTPDGQNPVGLIADARQRRQVLSALSAATLPVIDETMADLWLDAPIPRGALRAGGARVVRIGSLSKTFWAGLRVGWVRGPRSLVRHLAVVRAGQDLASSVLDQLVSVTALTAGSAALAERRAVAAQRRDALFDALALHAPEWTAVRPRGGLAAWVHLGGVSSTALALRARAAGVQITPGPRFTVRGTHDGWTRLPFTLSPDELHRAVTLLAAASRNAGPPATGRQRTEAGDAWTA